MKLMNLNSLKEWHNQINLNKMIILLRMIIDVKANLLIYQVLYNCKQKKRR